MHIIINSLREIKKEYPTMSEVKAQQEYEDELKLKKEAKAIEAAKPIEQRIGVIHQ